ncbi:hypothetical protein C8R46DRAFT_1342414 [Mycena filopes]|nr:hypothetical protein C8R46DRAFT_1342414 [Mycena filopes]
MPASKSLFDFPRSSYIMFPLLTFLSYLSAIPILFALSGPSGLAAKFLTPLLLNALRSVSSHGTSTTEAENNQQKAIVLLTAFYMACVYILSATMSSLGQLLGNGAGYHNREPRLNKRTITTGLPHRMIATHEALYDIFPAYAVTAALAAASQPRSTVPLNGLVLHVFLKLAVYSPVYLLDIDVVRSYSHMCAIAALLVALWSILAA